LNNYIIVNLISLMI